MVKKVFKSNQRPKCGEEEFISDPNQYDVLVFEAGRFEVSHTEDILENNKIFCRECGLVVDEIKSEELGKVVLVK